jgi:hypothetical protein
MAALAVPALADCSKLPNNATLKSALSKSITAGGTAGANGGLGFGAPSSTRAGSCARWRLPVRATRRNGSAAG